MRVERANISQVQDKIASLKRKIEDQKNAKPRESSLETHDSRVAAQIAEEEEKKRQKREAKERKKALLVTELETADPEIAELMGFGGFGTSKKK